MKKNFVKQNLGFPRLGKQAFAEGENVRNRGFLKEGGRGEPCERGFTLMEILIYIAVLTVIIVAISSFFLWAVYSNTKAKAMREVLDNARRAMEMMTYEIREAKSISPSTPAYLSLKRKDDTSINFYLCGTALCLEKGFEDPITLTSDRVEVSNLNFTQITTDTSISSIQIGLQVNYKNPANRPEYQAEVNVTSTASLRTY